MDPADLIAQFVDWRDDLQVVSEGNVDLMKMLEAVYAFKGKLFFFRPWLQKAPDTAELILEVDNLERVLVESREGTASSISPARLPAQVHALAPDPPSLDPFLRTHLAYKVPLRQLRGLPLPAILRRWHCL